MKNKSFTHAKTGVDKEECNKPENAGKYDKENEKKGSISVNQSWLEKLKKI